MKLIIQYTKNLINKFNFYEKAILSLDLSNYFTIYL